MGEMLRQGYSGRVSIALLVRTLWWFVALLLTRSRPQPITGLSAIQCRMKEGVRGRASANQRPPHHWVWRVLSSATGTPIN